jgi:CubicO group peptidase (beta-lactamase class C family)
MLDRGRHGRERILSRPSVETMTTDQLTPEQKAVSGLVPGFFDDHGWGFGVSIVTRRDNTSAVPGQYGWDGGMGTSWWSDPTEEMVAILPFLRISRSISRRPSTRQTTTDAAHSVTCDIQMSPRPSTSGFGLR